MLVPEKCWFPKILVEKILDAKDCWVPKKFWMLKIVGFRKNFGFRKILVPEKFLFPKNFGSRKILVPEKF